MLSIRLIKKIFIFIVSWTLIYTPITYAENTNDPEFKVDGLPNVSEQHDHAVETFKENSNEERGGNSEGNANENATENANENANLNSEGAVNQNDPKKGEGGTEACAVWEEQNKVCSQKQPSQVYNCHVGLCVSPQDHESYTDEYQDCNSRAENERAACRENLQNLAQEMRDYSNTLNTASGDTGGEVASSMVFWGVAACSIGCAFDSVGAWQAAILGLLLAFIQHQMKEGYKDTFEQQIDALKQVDAAGENGWSKHTQLGALTAQISALGTMKDAAKDLKSMHELILMIELIILIVAIILGIPPLAAFNPCAAWTAGFAAVGIILETNAISACSDLISKIETAETDAQTLKTKLESIYNQQNPSMTMERPNLAMSARQSNSNVLTGNLTDQGEGDTQKIAKTGMCTDKKGNATKCPCPDGCATFNFDIPNAGKNYTNATTAVGAKKYGKAATAVANGNMSATGAPAGDRAIARKVANRVAKYALAKKGTPKEIADAANFILDPNTATSREYYNKQFKRHFSPLKAAMLKHKTEGMFALEPKKEVVSNKKKKYKGAAYDAATALAALNKKLKDMEGELDLGGLDSLKGQNGPEMANVGKKIEGEVDVDATAKTINPDRKMSIFKIITNRYNLLRMRKRFVK